MFEKKIHLTGSSGGTLGKGYKLMLLFNINVDVIWKCLTHWVCTANMNNESSIDQMLQTRLKFADRGTEKTQTWRLDFSGTSVPSFHFNSSKTFRFDRQTDRKNTPFTMIYLSAGLCKAYNLKTFKTICYQKCKLW